MKLIEMVCIISCITAREEAKRGQAKNSDTCIGVVKNITRLKILRKQSKHL